MPFADFTDFADCEAKNKDKGDPGAYCGKIKHQVEGEVVIMPDIDPRGDGAVVDVLGDDGQGKNIIENMNSEPILFKMGENSSHEYPGKIVISNESRYVDREVKRSFIPNVAESGATQPLNDITQPTLPTGAPDHNMHGLNFNDKIEWNEVVVKPPCCTEAVSIPASLVSKDVGITDDCPECKRKTNEEQVEMASEYTYKEMKEALIKEDARQYIREAIAEQGDLKQDLPVSQAFSDEGNNPHIDATKLGKPFNEKSDTGDDQSRTGPGGLLQRDNYDSINYTGTSDTKIHIATPYYDGKEPHDVSGIVPEYQEDIRLTIEDPLQDENIPKIVLDIENENQDDVKEFSFSETDPSDVKGFTHSSSWVGNVKYYPETSQMEILMNGKQYIHCDVSERNFDAFEGAPSKGAHWNRFFKDQHRCAGFSEALNIYRDKAPNEFDWIDKDAMNEMKNYAITHGNGKFILCVVSGDSITDHRIEGKDEHRRHWTEEELIQNIRTGKGKLTDINHLWDKKDPYSGGIYDANWNFKTSRGEMILWETDQEILDAIRKNVITAVSINTGTPRKVDIQCETGECFITPKGVQLGEDNGIGLAFVVTAPEGFMYNGQLIPGMPPGMKFTKLYLVE